MVMEADSLLFSDDDDFGSFFSSAGGNPFGSFFQQARKQAKKSKK